VTLKCPINQKAKDTRVPNQDHIRETDAALETDAIDQDLIDVTAGVAAEVVRQIAKIDETAHDQTERADRDHLLKNQTKKLSTKPKILLIQMVEASLVQFQQTETMQPTIRITKAKVQMI